MPPALRLLIPDDGSEELVETPAARPETAGGGLTVGATVGAPPPSSLSQAVGPLRDFMREQELGYVNRALAQTGGDKEKAAQMLGVSVATLYRKLAEEDLVA